MLCVIVQSGILTYEAVKQLLCLWAHCALMTGPLRQLDAKCNFCWLQVLQGTKAVWFLGGQVNQVQEDCSSDVFSKVSAVHFPMNEWVHQYTSSLPADTKATDQQPSALYVGEML